MNQVKKDKDYAIKDFVEMTKNSWTWARMTLEERKDFMSSLEWADGQNLIKGDYHTRWHILQALYYTALEMLGYNHNCCREWRE